MTTCLGVSLWAPHRQFGDTPGTPTRKRKALSPITSVQSSVAIVLSGRARFASSCFQLVPHGVRHIGSLLPRPFSSPLFLHRSRSQWSSSSVTASAFAWPPWGLLSRVCCCSSSSLVASAWTRRAWAPFILALTLIASKKFKYLVWLLYPFLMLMWMKRTVGRIMRKILLSRKSSTAVC